MGRVDSPSNARSSSGLCLNKGAKVDLISSTASTPRLTRFPSVFSGEKMVDRAQRSVKRVERTGEFGFSNGRVS